MPEPVPQNILDELRSYPVHYRLQQIRLHLGYTQVEAAKLIGCTQNSISTWENGKSPPCPKMFMKIINAYGLPHYYFADMNIEKLKLQSRRQNRNIRYDDVDLV